MKIIEECNYLMGLILGGLLLASMHSCGNGSQQSYEEDSVMQEENHSGLDTVHITLESNDKMQFDKEEIVVYAGQAVVLKLVHTGTMPIASMGHNFVLLSNSISIADYAKRALREKEYIIDDPELTLAFTKMLGGGESTEIVFSAPDVGTYNFICSFPGHYSIMKGKFIVKY